MNSTKIQKTQEAYRTLSDLLMSDIPREVMVKSNLSQMKVDSKAELPSQDYAKQLMIVEYEAQMHLLEHMGDSVIARVNMFLTIVSAIMGGILLIVQGNGFSNHILNYVIYSIMSVVLCIGFLVYAEITQWVMYTIGVHRQLMMTKNSIFEGDDRSSDFDLRISVDLPYLRKRKTFRDI